MKEDYTCEKCNDTGLNEVGEDCAECLGLPEDATLDLVELFKGKRNASE